MIAKNMKKNKLTNAEAERLYLLLEEMAEVQQLIGKILRHGYESRWPLEGPTNRERLEQEIADVLVIVEMLLQNEDLDDNSVGIKMDLKELTIKPWLHYQEE
jgi:NTP pyrophosphatase (non-canonical NTP hydrolase)